MTATTIPFRDGALASHNRRMDTDTSDNLAAVNFEAPEQRAALIAALQLLGADATLVAIRDKLIATPATAAGQEAMRLLLAGTLATLPIIKPWAAWVSGTAIDMRNYAGVEIQVTTAGAATFMRSAADDANYTAISASSAGVAASSPLAVGFYNLKGGGWLKFTGAAAITVRGYN